MAKWITLAVLLDFLVFHTVILPGYSRRHRSVPFRPATPNELHNGGELDEGPAASNVEFVWYTQTVAAGDTAVLHCSFDAIFSQLRSGNIDWARVPSIRSGSEMDADAGEPVALATGRKVEVDDRRVRVYRPHNSALSVLIVRRVKKKDAGLYRCKLAGSSTRYKYMILNVTESQIDAKTSPPKLHTRIGRDVTLWCNATGYPQPVVYWTREDRTRKLPDGNYQYWGNGLHLETPTEQDTGVYSCYLDNFVQPVVSYKFSLFVEDTPWDIEGYKMRFDSTQWYSHDDPEPTPVQGMSYLLMCETSGLPKPLPKIRWLRDGKAIKNTRHFYIIEDRPEWRTGYTSSTLVLMRFVPRFQGNYTCEATNMFRKRRESFHITAPLGFHGDVVSDTDYEYGDRLAIDGSLYDDQYDFDLYSEDEAI